MARGRDWHQERIEGLTNRNDLVSTDDYSQARKLVMEVYDDAARERFVANVAGNLVYAPPFVRVRNRLLGVDFILCDDTEALTCWRACQFRSVHSRTCSTQLIKASVTRSERR